MPSRETLNFLDMAQMKFELTAEEMSDPKIIERTTGIRFQTGYSHESYRTFHDAIKKVCQELVVNDIELSESLNLEGLVPVADGPLMQFKPVGPVKLYRSDFDIHPLVFDTDEKVLAVAYVLTLWQNAFMQQKDPEALVRARLAKHGIVNWADFEANKDQLPAIHNPFTPP